jgi:PPOX class probable F420-dependent enzyme
MSILTPELREVIDSGPLAHVTCLAPDGTPHVTICWIGLEGDDVVSGHVKRPVKLDNIERDPRVVLSFQAPKAQGIVDHGVYLAPYVRIRARAVVEKTDDWHLLFNRLAKVYMTPDAPEMPPFTGYTVRYIVEEVSGIGPWGPGAEQPAS